VTQMPWWRTRDNLMSTLTRLFVCFASILLASGIVAIIGVWEPAAKLLHDRFFGAVVTFCILFFGTMVSITSGRLARSYWLILVSALLAYPIAAVTLLTCYLPMASGPQFKTLRRPEFFTSVMELLFFGTITFAWFFGILAGMIFLALRRITSVR
jgi:hypothetical protein